MNSVHLIHNPRAGEKKYSEEELAELLGKSGYKTRYFSTKKSGWKDFDSEADVLLVAGGDGTIRKVVKELLGRKLIDKPERLAIFPLGTANNISGALKIPADPEKVTALLKKRKIKNYDVGTISGLSGQSFFLESFGCGIFAALMREMEKIQGHKSRPVTERLKLAYLRLLKLISSYNPKRCIIEADGKDYSGKYVLVEIMNAPCIGPKLYLSRKSDPSDGVLELILIPETEKEKFIAYVRSKLKGREARFSFQTVRGKKFKIKCEDGYIHADDELVKTKHDVEVCIQVKKRLLSFAVP